MNKWCKAFLILATGIAAVLFSTISAHSQGKRDLIGGSEVARPAGSSTTKTRTVYLKQPPKIIIKNVNVTSLIVTTQPGAKVVLQSLGKGSKPYKKEMTVGADGNAKFEYLPGGTYKAEASKDGFESVENDNVTIVPQTSQAVSLDLKPITYKLRIATNLSVGDIRFAPADYLGLNPDGSIKSIQKGPFCVVKIESNGEAQISDLEKGYYDIDIRPGAPEYDQKLVGVNVPYADESDESAPEKIKPIQIHLEKKPSAEEFTAAAWIKEDWDLPLGWRLDKGMKVKGVGGVALPHPDRFRYYKDFELIAKVLLNEGGTAGLALWAKDDRNYYLLQINGPRSETPNYVGLWIVKDGSILRKVGGLIATSFLPALSSKSGFRVRVKGEKDRAIFTIDMEDTNGDYQPVGQLRDDVNTYLIGAPGIANLQRSDFEVKFFRVCPSACQ